MNQFRFHRGGFAESMATAVPASTRADLVRITGTDNLMVKPYSGIDSRNGWDTHVVTDEHGVLGFTDGMPKSTENEVLHLRALVEALVLICFFQLLA